LVCISKSIKIFRPKGRPYTDVFKNEARELTEEWKKIPNQSTVNVTKSMAEMRNAYRILVENPEEKKPLVSCERRWEYNISERMLKK
jgi:hypothetical protein